MDRLEPFTLLTHIARWWIAIVCVLHAAILIDRLWAEETVADKPTNVVVLYGDDWRYDTLGCAGNSIVQNRDSISLPVKAFDSLTIALQRRFAASVARVCLLASGCRAMATQPFAEFKTPWSETYPGMLRAAVTTSVMSENGTTASFPLSNLISAELTPVHIGSNRRTGRRSM